MDRRNGRRNRVALLSDEDEKAIPDQEDQADTHSHNSSEEDNDLLNEASSSGPVKTLQDDIKYFLDRVLYIGETNPQDVLEREESLKNMLLELLQNLSDMKLFIRNSKQFMKLVKPKAEDRANSEANAATVWPEIEQVNKVAYTAESDPSYAKFVQIIEQARTRYERESFQESRKQQRGAADRSSQCRSGATGDEDVAVVQEEGPRVCPITKRPPEQPVRNRLCGHVYDRAGVEHYMRSSKNPTCPMAGCMNRKRLEAEQLENMEPSGTQNHI